MSERCETCRYWAADEAMLEGQRVCRRKPPVPMEDGGTAWPWTYPESWCGEWREREPECFGLRKPTFGLGDPQDPSQR